VPGAVQRALKQSAPLASPELEVLLALRIAAARVVEPWARFLKETSKLTPNQYNVLRILRGSHPSPLTCGDIVERMIDRDPDVTRLVDRLEKQGLVQRLRNARDRRIVEVTISAKGLALVQQLDPHVRRLPGALLGHLGQDRLESLRDLMDALITELGTFP
jgi:DNA-binding MarR family transcriptional regulator